MTRRALGIAGAVLTLSQAPCRAEDANTLKAGLARYFGAGALTVAPAGPGFRVDVDVKALLGGLERFGMAIGPASYALTLTPGDDGAWQVAGGAFPPITAKIGDQTTRVVSNNQSFAGRFDPRVPSFTEWTGRYDSLSVGAAQDASDQTRLLTEGRQTFTATPKGDGVVDAALSQTNASYAQDITLGRPGAPLDIAIKGGPTRDRSDVAGLRVRALADVWAFLVAHPSADVLKADQPVLRGLLRAALPLFDRWSQDGSLDGLVVDSPFGPIKAERVATHVTTSGLVADAAADLSLHADGLSLPAGALPAWTAAVLPTSIALQTALSGFHLAEAARTIVDALDVSGPQLVPQATLDRVGPMLGSPDAMTVSIGESRIASPTIDLRFAGAIRPTRPTPHVDLTLHATGLDRAIAAIGPAAAGDRAAQQAMAVLLLVKGYGKAEPDGALTWVVSLDENRAVTINGVPLPTAGHEETNP